MRTSKVSVKKLSDDLVERVRSGWCPTMNQVVKTYSKYAQKAEVDPTALAQKVIFSCRKTLKKEGLYFYFSDGMYKILDTPEEKVDVSTKLWSITSAFTRSTHNLLDQAIVDHPELAETFVGTLKGRLDVINTMAVGVTEAIAEEIQKAKEYSDED